MLFNFNIKSKIIEVNCQDMHKALIDMGEVICFMCNEQITKIDTTRDKYLCSGCDKRSIIDYNGMIVCTNSVCGIVEGYHYKPAFREAWVLKKKSIYKPAYHIYNTIGQIAKKQSIQVPSRVYDLIIKVARLMKISENIMQGRKRLINLNYIIREIFLLFRLLTNDISQPKSKINRQKYNDIWISVMESDIGDLIRLEVSKFFKLDHQRGSMN